MSDTKYFVKVQDGDGRVSIKYSDTVYKENLDSTSEEFELSEDYFIVSTKGEPYGTTRSIIKGKFIFSGYELVGGTLFGGITVLPTGQLSVANLMVPVDISFGEYDPFKALKDANNVITSYSMGEYSKFFPQGWANRPFEDNLISVGSTSDSSESSSGGSTSTSVQSGVNPMTTITPFTRQVNEGDSLSTTLSGFTPNSTIFFSVTGRGINKKDFSAGVVKGRVRVDGSGVATISHTLRADKATEGEESFSVQVFSDKRMRNSLGQSDAVTVFDTSVKAPKVGKPPKGGGGVKEPTNPIGKETGRFIEFDDGIKFFSGQTYTHDSVTGQKLLKYGQNALATYCPKLSCTDDDDIRLANQEIDPVTGYRSLDALPPGATYQWNFQFNETYLALTGQYTNGDIKTTSRVVYKGVNTFEGDKLVKYQPQLDANVYVNGHSPERAYSGSVKEVSGKNFSAPFTFRGSDKGGIGTSR